MYTQVYKPIQLTGIILCSLMLVLSSCKDSAVSSEKEQTNSKIEVATSASGKTIQIADASTAQDIYWTGQKSRTQDPIIGHSYINKNGEAATEVIYRGEELGNPYGVAIDIANDQIYWTDTGGFIAKAALDGSGTIDTLYSTENGVTTPVYLSIDFVNETLLWTDQNNILKGSLDGSAPVETIYSANDGLNISYGIDLLILGDLMYWTDISNNEILAGRTQGDIDPYVLFNSSDANPALSSLLDLEIDLLSGRLYVADGFSETSSRILRGRLDGQDSLETIYSGEDEFVAASSLTIDHVHRKLYWSQAAGVDFAGTILRGPLDGNGTPELVYDLRDFEGVGISQLYSISIPGPLGLKSKRVENQQEDVVHLHF